MSGFTGKFLKVSRDKSNAYSTHDAFTGESFPINDLNTATVSSAFHNGDFLGEYTTSTGRTQWRRISPDDAAYRNNLHEKVKNGTTTHSEFVLYVHNSMAVKPPLLKMSELKWKYLIRSALRGRNIMMTGPAGSGKTLSVKAVAEALPTRPFFSFNLGSTQDPRASLIGNTMANSDGTYFDQSAFITAISTPNAIILLDELTRAHPEAWNILMTVLDQGQRYVRLDEAPESPVINVAEGVSFIATANIGIEYTATRVLDQAIRDRFIIIEIDVLDFEEETDLLTMMYPNLPKDILKGMASIAATTRAEASKDDGKVSKMISTRNNVEAAGLLFDGFRLSEIAEIVYYPTFDSDGGADSERSYIKQVVQKYQHLDRPVMEFLHTLG